MHKALQIPEDLVTFNTAIASLEPELLGQRSLKLRALGLRSLGFQV